MIGFLRGKLVHKMPPLVVIDVNGVGYEVEAPLSVFYDRNGNGELDTNFIGIPKEPIALSNNATGKFGPPKYEDAVFTLGLEPRVQEIRITEI